LLKGDPGIGKTRLAEELLEWASSANTCTAKCACYATGARMSYAPLAEWFRSKSLRNTVAALPLLHRAQLARLIPGVAMDESRIEPPQPLTEGWQRHQFFDSIARALLSSGQDLLLLIDDLHWCDNDTLEWLHYFLRFDDDARFLIVATVRPAEFDYHENLLSLVRELRRSDQVSEIDLVPLTNTETASLATHVSGNELDESSSKWLFQQTSGNPLFIVETVRAGMLENQRGEPENTDNAALNLSPAPLSPKILAVLGSRTAQLTEKARLFIRAAAILGRPFTARIIAHVCQETEETTAAALDELWKRRLIEAYGSEYRFTHERLREFAESEAGPALRQLLHRRAADALGALWPSHDNSVAADIADHYEKAGAPEQAIPYYLRAAEVLQQRYAHAESVRLLEKALSLCEQLPYSDSRDQTELSLLVPLGAALMFTRGYADSAVGRTYGRARLLSECLGGSPSEFSIVYASWVFNLVRAQFQPSKQFALRLLDVGNLRSDCGLQATGHFALGSYCFHTGELSLGQKHFEKALLLNDSVRDGSGVLLFGIDVAVFSRSYLSHVLSLTGKQQEADRESELAIHLARELSQPFGLSLALAYAAMRHQFDDQPEKSQSLAAEAADLCREYGFRYYLIWTSILRGWARARNGSAEEGLVEMREGLAALRASEAKLREPYYLGLIADTYLRLKQPEEGLGCLAEATEIATNTEEVWVQPELNRIRGELQLEIGNLEEAEASLQTALRSAQQIGANALVPRIAIPLARIWRQCGKHEKASRLLGSVLTTV
jgi:tetratricopeptide (TPR) repeat protein